ncbi:peptide ABC transporter substrate-binding protein [Bradyrhizobium sp. CCBAU 11386]|uniref:ABC transporter substrate-binding protein n=1 Tax=Bradyrhizobium sp. CCBAU 11386 TaxID=1630837 RepID=UPI0023034A53|nr:ABC transporter substrate-binding protein [Bradyrhizobium sp. CCBAU 11386]MDA9510711.1 peptide ABC transporter substrate-binding protein [Bradyrhizobium sp. CCBAU 11386]
MRRRRPSPAWAIGLAALALLAMLGKAGAETLLRTRLNADIRSTDPGTNRDANTDGVIAHVVEGLVAFRDDTSIGPMLAESWAVSNEGKTYTFRLRQGVKFHNGATMTSDDVVWSLKRWLDQATQWRCLSEFSATGIARIEKVEAPDPQTVVMTLDQPTALFLPTLARPDCGQTAIIHRDSVGADGKWIAPIGTGPFKLAEWKRGQYVDVVRFDGYVSRSEPRTGYTGAKDARVDRVRFNVIPDSSAAKAGLLSGSLDVIMSLSIPDLEELKSRPEVQLSITPALGLTGILFQTKDPLLKDVRIRCAIALSIDTAQIVDAVMMGTARPNNSALPLGSPFYSETQSHGYAQNIAEAKKLLLEAGYRGQPVKMITNKRYSFVFDSSVLVQAMAQTVGINIELEVMDWAAQLDRYNRGDYQSMAFTYSARLDPSLSFEMLTGPKATQPRKVWDNPEAQDMLRQSMMIDDAAKRQALFDDMHKRFIADVPMIVLFNGAELTALRKGIKGYAGWLYPQPRFWGVTVE